MCGLEIKVVRHLILKRLDLRRKELDDLTAFGADHVVMVLMFEVMLVVGFVVAKADLTGEASLGKEVQSAVESRLYDCRVLFLY